MEVFITWSGDRSRKLGDAIYKWLPSVLQAVKPFFSPDRIAKGSRWNYELSKRLETVQVGLLCVTPENREAPWLHYEAGALSKNLEASRVCPLLFEIEPTEMTGPLTHLSWATYSKEEFRRVIRMINDANPADRLTAEIVDKSFDRSWPELATEVDGILSEKNDAADETRSEKDMIKEILEIARRIASSGIGESWGGNPFTFIGVEVERAVKQYSEIVRVASKQPLPADLHRAISMLEHPLFLSLVLSTIPWGNKLESLPGTVDEMKQALELLYLRSSGDDHSQE